MMQYIPFILFALAPIANAFCDTVDDHFSSSIFRNLDEKFWAKNVSFRYHKEILGVRMDAWHIGKFIMLGGIFGSITWALCLPNSGNISILNLAVKFTILATEWQLLFGIFYNRIFWNSKKYKQHF